MQQASRTSAGIRIEAVRVRGFRALRDVCVRLDAETTVLVGENNTGKSAFLEALDVAVGTRQAVPDDLHVDAAGGRSREFSVDVLLVPAAGHRFTGHLAPVLADAVRRVEAHPDTREFVGPARIRGMGGLKSLVWG